MRKLLVLGPLLLVLASCGMEGNTPPRPEAEAPEEEAPESDYQSDLSCEHFRGAAYDVTQGLLTDAEFREEIKKVNDFASIAHPDVQEAAEGMLAALTQGDMDAFNEQVTAMGDACRAEGF